MQILNLILSVLAVVLAGAALITVMGEKRRCSEQTAAINQRISGIVKSGKESRKAMLQYVDAANKSTAEATEKLVKTVNGRVDKVLTALRGVNSKAEEAKKAAKDNADHIAELEQGVVPDFETARKAVDEVNKFNEGIAGILGFDPLNALKKGRQEAD